MEINDQKLRIEGCAAFRTHKGLEVHGRGVLSAAPTSIYELGRQRGGILGSVGTRDRLIFFRRLVSVEKEVNLIGTVSPCFDSFKRNGLLGACVAVPLDNKNNGQFQDWGTLEVAFTSQNRELSEASPEEAHYDWCSSLTIQQEDIRFDWRVPFENILYLHRDAGMSTLEVLQSIQAVAKQVGGTRYPTIFVLDRPIEGFASLSFGSPDIQRHIMAMKDEQNKFKLRTFQRASSSNSLHIGSNADYSISSTETEINSKPDLLSKIERLLEQQRSMKLQIDKLMQEVESLRGIVYDSRSQKPLPSTRQRPIPIPLGHRTDPYRSDIKNVVVMFVILLCVLAGTVGSVYLILKYI